jgi:hypothetical protein
MRQALISIAVLVALAGFGFGFGARGTPDLSGNYSVVSEFPPECGCGLVGGMTIGAGSGGGYKVYFSIAGTDCESSRRVGEAEPVPYVAEAYEIPSVNGTFLYLVSTSPGRVAIVTSEQSYCVGVAVSE